MGGIGAVLAPLMTKSVLLPAALGAASIGTQMMQAKSAKKSAEEARRASEAMWQRSAYPSTTAVEATGTQQRGQLGQARLQAYQNLASNLAARGFGPGSGLMAERAGDIERGYLQSLGEMATELTKFKHTPMFGLPSAAYPQVTTGAAEAGLGKASDLMDTAMGFILMKDILKGNKEGEEEI